MTGANQQCSEKVNFHTNFQNALSNRELELYELARISDIAIDPQVFKVLIDLLKLDVSPAAMFNVLQNMALQVSKSSTVSKKNTQNKSGNVSTPNKKKPPVAAKPKKIRVETHDLHFDI